MTGLIKFLNRNLTPRSWSSWAAARALSRAVAAKCAATAAWEAERSVPMTARPIAGAGAPEELSAISLSDAVMRLKPLV